MLTLDDLVIAQGDFTLRAALRVPPGLTAVIGPSGAGKSTLLQAVAGFIAPHAGRVLWDGADLSGRPPGQRPVSVLFQDNNLFPHLAVVQNIGLALRPRPRLSQAETDRVAASLASVGLAGLGARKPAALSGGQQSRAALARVLLADRPVVLLDEAFAALGPRLKNEMLALVRDTLVARGKTVLMVTHAPDDAQGHADQVVFIADGVARPPVATAAFFADPPPAVRDYLGD